MIVKNKKTKKKRALVYLWTGSGAGKTTSALGVALRAVGHNQKVVIIQFLKGRKNIGEYKIRKRLRPNYEIYQFGRKQYVNPKKLRPVDYKLAQKGLEFAKKIVKKKKPNLLILDEINLALAGRLIELKAVVKFLDSVPAKTTVYLTGRLAPKELIKRADFATKIEQIKHPLRKRIPARKGIEY